MSVHVDQRDRVAILTLDDAERRNALSKPLVDDIVAAVDALEADDGVGALVVTGAPPAFCAGADLSDLMRSSDRAGDGGDEDAADTDAADTDAAAAASLRSIYEGFLRVARSSLPTVAAVNGPAVGAGLNMALGCDVVVAGESARFDSRFLALGLHPGGGGTWLMHRSLGAQTTAALALFGQRIDGRRAAEIGLAWRCVADDELLDTAVELATPASEAPKALVAKLKETLRAWPAVDTHEEAVDRELTPQIWSVRQPEFRDRLAAMQRKISSKP